MSIRKRVVICFLFSIFDVLETTDMVFYRAGGEVVICFLFSIFDVLETTHVRKCAADKRL